MQRYVYLCIHIRRANKGKDPGDLELCPFQQKNENALSVVPSALQKGVSIAWKSYSRTNFPVASLQAPIFPSLL